MHKNCDHEVHNVNAWLRVIEPNTRPQITLSMFPDQHLQGLLSSTSVCFTGTPHCLFRVRTRGTNSRQIRIQAATQTLLFRSHTPLPIPRQMMYSSMTNTPPPIQAASSVLCIIGPRKKQQYLQLLIHDGPSRKKQQPIISHNNTLCQFLDEETSWVTDFKLQQPQNLEETPPHFSSSYNPCYNPSLTSRSNEATIVPVNKGICVRERDQTFTRESVARTPFKSPLPNRPRRSLLPHVKSRSSACCTRSSSDDVAPSSMSWRVIAPLATSAATHAYSATHRTFVRFVMHLSTSVEHVKHLILCETSTVGSESTTNSGTVTHPPFNRGTGTCESQTMVQSTIL